jgi:hypothetical protein
MRGLQIAFWARVSTSCGHTSSALPQDLAKLVAGITVVSVMIAERKPTQSCTTRIASQAVVQFRVSPVSGRYTGERPRRRRPGFSDAQRRYSRPGHSPPRQRSCHADPSASPALQLPRCPPPPSSRLPKPAPSSASNPACLSPCCSRRVLSRARLCETMRVPTSPRRISKKRCCLAGCRCCSVCQSHRLFPCQRLPVPPQILGRHKSRMALPGQMTRTRERCT